MKQTVTKLLMLCLIAMGLTACDGIGSLASNAKTLTPTTTRWSLSVTQSLLCPANCRIFLKIMRGDLPPLHDFRRRDNRRNLRHRYCHTIQNARRDNPNIDIVVMDGAGNDILIPVITMFDWYNCKTEWYQWWG